MIYDKVENYKNYKLGKAWDEALSFISGLTEESEERRYELSSGMFAIVMAYPTISPKTAVLESHLKYIDIQATITGAEGIEWFATEDLSVKEPYDLERDVIFYDYPENAPAYTSNIPGYFTLLFPSDAHMPQLDIKNIGKVKKVVVKIPVELF